MLDFKFVHFLTEGLKKSVHQLYLSSTLRSRLFLWKRWPCHLYQFAILWLMMLPTPGQGNLGGTKTTQTSNAEWDDVFFFSAHMRPLMILTFYLLLIMLQHGVQVDDVIALTTHLCITRWVVFVPSNIAFFVFVSAAQAINTKELRAL